MSSWFEPLRIGRGPARLEVTTVPPASPGAAPRLAAASGSVLNPTLRIRTGQQLDFDVTNRLAEETTIHWHGLVVDWNDDGHPRHPIPPGGSRRYSFPMINRGGLYWYHPHPHGHTAEQVYRGVAGMLVVEDHDDDALRASLGLGDGPAEIVAVIRDERGYDPQPLSYVPTPAQRVMGYQGDTLTVNGEAGMRRVVSPGWVRLRLLNGSNARTLLLGFASDGGGPPPVFLVGTDGGLLERPVPLGRIFLGSAERVDVAVDASAFAGAAIRLRSHPFDPMHQEGGGHGHHAPEDSGAVDLLSLAVTAGPPRPGSLPARLSTLPPAAGDAPVREWVLSFDPEAARWLISGRTYDPDDPIRIPPRPEVWHILNTYGSMPHPMHLHGSAFRVLGRTGSPPQVSGLAVDDRGRVATDFGAKDTVLAWPGERLRIAVDFRHPFPGEQRLLYHCHILEHEDNGMMADLLITGTP